ncbi:MULTISPECIES: DUF6325 family protein [unclassified Gordonia (in: high G+C Gram-positive bacteria)]|uniref:DUF6325 family protein n=1 Tax=unclassified Gordonia (in: high G+C Gram-positive bacteria) TaxID=2657482 RepID=UPI001F0CDF95|nr:DUF6325 family protein [Gordonia sp. ABSL49_1]MCH5641489.1 DUF6325 family protein [Gordonia sp. ABSL49_1]
MTTSDVTDGAPERDLGPIDYIVIEWTSGKPTGEAIPHLIDLVDRGIVRVIDVVFVAKSEDGIVTRFALDELGADFEVFDGAATDLIGDDDVSEAAAAIAPGTAAAILVWENLWAAPFATAVHNNGGEVVASGRIPVQDLLERLESAGA